MVRVGLIGCGRWGRLILRDLKVLGCWVGVVAANSGSIANAQSAFADLIVPTIDELPELDAYIVAVPTILHGEVVLRLVPRGVPIYCEKPLTNNVGSAQEIVETAADQVFVMDKWRYHAGVHALRDLVRSGELGPVLGVKTTRLQWGCPHDDVDPAWILLPHDLTIALEILGFLPKPVHAIAESDADGLFGLSAWLSGPAWLHCEVGTRSPQYKRKIELRCRDGVAVLADSYDQHISVLRSDLGSRRREPPMYEQRPFVDSMPLLAEITAFIEYVEGTGPMPKSSALEGLQVVETIAKLRKLARVADSI
ncbi:MAG: Gfo/Idh/MocA family oxidoreductase [Methylobacter sp.]|uniref:Gfo/Idh/MocA family protein n=1 Tax=Methylobacter sp. TaxID=2051955 RepID=UPI00272F95E7|nr:Gfo/Idh/MocA family oxidoreductase [Methylobacter sp.]MDP1664050.1 Gfo/Idh/MocA family oxidoreductase [Methylobacter sp.]